MVPVVINSSNVNVASDSNSDSSEKDLKNNNNNFWWWHQWPSDNYPPNHCQCQCDTSYEKAQSFVKWPWQQNCQASKKRKGFHQKYKFLHQLGYGDHRHQASTWTISMQTIMQNGKAWSKRNLPTWTSNRWGTRQAKVLCPPIKGVLKQVCLHWMWVQLGTWFWLFLKTTLW